MKTVSLKRNAINPAPINNDVEFTKRFLYLIIVLILCVDALLLFGCSEEFEPCEDGSVSICDGQSISYCVSGYRQSMIDCAAFRPAAFDIEYGCFEYDDGATCEATTVPVDVYDDPDTPRKLSRSDSNSVINRLASEFNATVIKTYKGPSQTGMRFVKIRNNTPTLAIKQAAHEFEHRRQINARGSHYIKYNRDVRYRYWSEIQANITELSAWYAYSGGIEDWKVMEQVGNMDNDSYGFSSSQVSLSQKIYHDAAGILRSGGMTSSFSPVTDVIVDELLEIGYLVD